MGRGTFFIHQIMNQTIKEKWITALTDGSYQQGRAALHTMSDKYCCLGVLCDLYIKETKKALWVDDGEVEHPSGEGRLFFRSMLHPEKPLEASFLPDEVRQWAGIEQIPLQFNDGVSRSVTGRLMELNDGQSFAPRTSPFPFAAIAQFIQDNL